MPDPLRAYLGPACPRCGVALDATLMVAGEQVCPACSRTFLATPFAPPPPRGPRVETMAETGPAGAVPCARHPGNAAVANCTRCGVFMCSLCKIDIDQQELCPACFDRLASEGVLTSTRNRIRDYRGIAVLSGLVGCLLWVLGPLTGPVTLFLAYQAFRQRRMMNESGGMAPLVFAVLLGLLQIAGGIFFVWSIVSTS
jgi:hypothetical protein